MSLQNDAQYQKMLLQQTMISSTMNMIQQQNAAILPGLNHRVQYDMTTDSNICRFNNFIASVPVWVVQSIGLTIAHSLEQLDIALDAIFKGNGTNGVKDYAAHIEHQLTKAGVTINHGRHRTSPQAPYGYPTGAPGSGTRGRAGGPITSAYTTGAFSAEPSPPPAIEEAGIRAGEIIAWRTWRLEPREKIAPKTPLVPLPFVSRERLAPAKYMQEVVPATPLLRSTYKSTIWEPGKALEAHGDPAEQDYNSSARTASNFVGIFGWKTLGQLCKYVLELQWQNQDPFDPRPRPSIAIGQVAMWGSVIEHQHGYRAQFAKPHRIFMISDSEGNGANELLRVELCKLYGLPKEGV